MDFCYILFLSFLLSAAHGFRKHTINSSLLFSCDDSDVKSDISSLQQKVEENGRALSELQQTCTVSAVLAEISLLRDEIRAYSDQVPTAPIGSFSNPANHCSEIEAAYGTGTYSLNVAGSIVNVTCDFDVQLPPLSPVIGWQEIANIDLSDPAQSCPSPWRETRSRRCELTSNNGGCESVLFPTNSVPFTKLCGRSVGYGINSPDALNAVRAICAGVICGINDPYVDGLSITYGPSNNRQHLWSLASEHLRTSRCPCANNGFASPDFVGNDYYCETSNSMLWQGEGCTDAEGPCCSNPNLPWFCREFDQPIVTDNIEVRICTDQRRSDEDVEIDLLKMYIQ